MNDIPQELLNLKNDLKNKFKEIHIVHIESAYLFNAPIFKLHLGNDLNVNDCDYWEYVNVKNDLKLSFGLTEFLQASPWNKADQTFLNIYYLNDKTIGRAKTMLENFDKIDPKLVELVIPFTIDFENPFNSGSIVSFCLIKDKSK